MGGIKTISFTKAEARRKVLNCAKQYHQKLLSKIMIVYRERRHNKICYIEVVFYTPTQAGTPLYGCSPLRGQVGLSEINSKNYDIILDKVKSTPVTPVTSSSMSEYSDSTYNIKTEIEQQQKHLSNNEVLEIISKYKAGKSTYELAKEYGCHRRTISDNLKKRGIKVTNQLMERKGVVLI